MDPLDLVQNLGSLALFVLVILLAVDLTRSKPRATLPMERWRVLLLLVVIFATIVVVASALTFAM